MHYMKGFGVWLVSWIHGLLEKEMSQGVGGTCITRTKSRGIYPLLLELLCVSS
jgi:hypothetical protein